MAIFKFNVGDDVKDTLTGYKGVIEARTEWLNGCIRYQVLSRKLKDGKVQDAHVFDEQQLAIIKTAKPKEPAFRGGPKNDIKSPTAALLR